MMDPHRRAERVLDAARTQGLRLATAESCTGGLIAGALTAVPGSSEVIERGFITYSNRAKREMLDVPEHLLDDFGAVSPEVARAMAEGALANAPVQVTVAVTGVAGPGGGTREKPVGLVHMAATRESAAPRQERHIFPGDRDTVREETVLAALSLLLKVLEEPGQP